MEHSAAISEIQGYLNGISYYNSKIPRIIPDGIYGRESEITVRAFQQEYGLPVTGQINKVTWNKIVDIYKRLVTPEPERILVFESKNSVMRQGDKGYDVTLLQIMLNLILEHSDNNMQKINTSGFFDNATVKAVKAFQNLALAEQTGYVDVKTWNLIVKVFNYMSS
ncbi:MAG: peptidoglycan-binding protein [Oscillospiraceae bacterium]